jgi:hypothetical protein
VLSPHWFFAPLLEVFRSAPRWLEIKIDTVNDPASWGEMNQASDSASPIRPDRSYRQSRITLLQGRIKLAALRVEQVQHTGHQSGVIRAPSASVIR